MILWCAYCQTFQGESPPRDSYDLTHRTCRACVRRSRLTDDDAIAAIQPLARFYREVRDQARDGFGASGADLLDEAGRLGVGPVDLLVGMLQPALVEIGTAWARGEVSVAHEHRFTAAVAVATSAALARLPDAAGARRASAPDYLLVAADGNYHTLGLEVVELILRSAGRSTFVVAPGVPSAEIVELVRSVRPKNLGLSVALAEQAERVLAVIRDVRRLPAKARPRMIVGGYCVKMGLRFPAALRVETCADARSLLSTPRTRGMASARGSAKG